MDRKRRISILATILAIIMVVVLIYVLTRPSVKDANLAEKVTENIPTQEVPNDFLQPIQPTEPTQNPAPGVAGVQNNGVMAPTGPAEWFMGAIVASIAASIIGLTVTRKIVEN